MHPHVLRDSQSPVNTHHIYLWTSAQAQACTHAYFTCMQLHTEILTQGHMHTLLRTLPELNPYHISPAPWYHPT